MFDDSRDFLQAHYLTSTRDDSPFWLANKHELVLSDNIREKISIYKSGLPVNWVQSKEEAYYESLDNEFHKFWQNGSYYCIFSGMGFLPDRPWSRLVYRSTAEEDGRMILSKIKEKQHELLRVLPTNYEYLRSFHAEKMSGNRSPALKMSGTSELVGPGAAAG